MWQQQSYQNYEVICIDDGSTDDSESIVKGYLKDKRIKLVRQNNNGAASARNKGLSLAKGKYVWFVDSDDIVRPDLLQKNINLLEKMMGILIYLI